MLCKFSISSLSTFAPAKFLPDFTSLAPGFIINYHLLNHRRRVGASRVPAELSVRLKSKAMLSFKADKAM